MTDRTTDEVAGEAMSALRDCLSLIEDMSRFVGHMSLKDYALFNEAPIRGEKAIAALEDLRRRSLLVRRLGSQRKARS